MNRHLSVRALIAFGVFVSLAGGTASFAQGGPPGGGRTPLTPAQQAKRDAWEKWNGNHLYVVALRNTVRGLGRLDKDPKTALNKPQAKQILSVILAWHNKPTVTDEQAKKISDQIVAPLSDAQKVALTARPQRGGGRGGPGGGPGGAPGGAMARPAGGAPGGAPAGAPGGGFGGRGGGGMRGGGGAGNYVMPDPHDYNPLNPATIPGPPMMVDRMKKSMDDLIKDLEARAK